MRQRQTSSRSSRPKILLQRGFRDRRTNPTQTVARWPDARVQSRLSASAAILAWFVQCLVPSRQRTPSVVVLPSYPANLFQARHRTLRQARGPGGRCEWPPESAEVPLSRSSRRVDPDSRADPDLRPQPVHACDREPDAAVTGRVRRHRRRTMDGVATEEVVRPPQGTERALPRAVDPAVHMEAADRRRGARRAGRGVKQPGDCPDR